MATIGYRDGVLTAKAVALEQKRFKMDIYPYVYSSATILKASVSAGATTSFTLGTTLGVPRALKVINNLQAASERAMKLVIKGYTSEGNYDEETLTLSSAATGRTAGNVAFAYVSSIVPAVATKGYGTYSTVSIYPTDKFGLTERCESEGDILQVSAWGATAGNTYTATSYPINSTTFSPTYNSVDLTTIGAAGSTLAIKYLSKFQRKNTM